MELALPYIAAASRTSAATSDFGASTDAFVRHAIVVPGVALAASTRPEGPTRAATTRRAGPEGAPVRVGGDITAAHAAARGGSRSSRSTRHASASFERPAADASAASSRWTPARGPGGEAPARGRGVQTAQEREKALEDPQPHRSPPSGEERAAGLPRAAHGRGLRVNRDPLDILDGEFPFNVHHIAAAVDGEAQPTNAVVDRYTVARRGVLVRRRRPRGRPRR